MKYAELSDEAKRTALEQWRNGMTHDEWWEHVYTDAREIASKLGIEIDDRHNRTIAGIKIATPDINFSGFCSQGDGACFSGTLWVEALGKAVDKIEEHLPNLEEEDALHRMAVFGRGIYEAVLAHWTSNRISGEPLNELDCPECTPDMRVRITGESHRGFSTEVESGDVPVAIEDDMNEFVQDFAGWIYKQLEAEHDHLCSDESTLASIEANEPEFDEDGKLL